MSVTILRSFSSDGLFARAMRSSAWTASGFAISQVIRLASNLVLTRLLLPEAFGLMALVTVAMIGLANFSDVGVGQAIMANRRGDDADFLDTAWTIQVARGGLLWLATCALAAPVAALYDEPSLARILPVAGLTLLIAGFNPTRIETANRHLALGRVMLLDLTSQAIGVAVMVAAAVTTQSVWALVIGGIVGALAKLALMTRFLAGQGNRFRWEPDAGRELVGFGKWIFFSTVFGFVIAQGDRVILGKYLSLEWLGIYNIGYFLASAPLLLGGAIIGRVMIPLYRQGVIDPDANLAKTRAMRRVLTGVLLGALLTMAFLGVPLIDALYDARYAAGGPAVILIACAQIPSVIGMTYDQAALAAGDSRRFCYVLAAKAALFSTLFLIGAERGGLVGALVGQGLALLLAYPLIIWLARRYGQWDPAHDIAYATVGLACAATAIWLNWGAIALLTASSALP